MSVDKGLSIKKRKKRKKKKRKKGRKAEYTKQCSDALATAKADHLNMF